ncbi:predicted protein [Brucella abortus bv. 4 str. 292]|uniref:Uncharacterized protein n=10 Tax=Brucella TaxID=234 RepID=Q2YK46_BRUA2|nr:hypothetical protein BRA0387 [Brucella suis 1330]AAX76207.1 hypothetical protein BruAb2_0814 [Brucella abortus bv. 1 str. 9-941]ABX63574.1 Hypothetical protein, conserved [Brucella canis ATCC 23365]ACO02220.1 Hypothetical protein, conserved [Brucella melitensis ATCC 23457]ACU49518.1 hypothetical protein BMI_II384 [Brucella microti CCM 4915]AEK55815.1 hypothetical protein BPI_II367 [Brucella pinnipedialis B2/94]AEU07534.1 hypothetical protein BSVBI22_B0383 [Brucella suis VBI22]AHN48133.1 h
MVHVRIVLDQNHMAGPCIPGIQGTTFDIGFPNHRGEFPALFAPAQEACPPNFL